MMVEITDKEIIAKLKARIAELEASQKKSADNERLRAALQSIAGQTDDCEADETYYGGLWREVNHTAKAALREDEKGATCDRCGEPYSRQVGYCTCAGA